MALWGWVCVLVTSNVPKRKKKRNQLAFLPNVYIEKFTPVFLVLGNFPTFSLAFWIPKSSCVRIHRVLILNIYTATISGATSEGN